MPNQTDVQGFCCVALELSNSSWVCAFSPPEGKTSVHKMAARDVDRLIGLVESQRAKAERVAKRQLDVVLCYEVGYDGFWLARLLIARGIRTIVFDPASFLQPRRGRLAKTDRLDAEGMTRTLRAWLSGQHEVAREVQVPTVEEEDAKRIERERKNLVEERTRIVGRIKGLLALHGIHLSGKRIGKGLLEQLDTPSPYSSGDVSRDRGINKAGTKLARQTLVELAWFWLRYQPASNLARWWHERFGDKGMRGRKVGIVALARKLAIALWRFVEAGVIPEGAALKA